MTQIEWTDKTFNPIHLVREDGSHGGHFCIKSSEGCLHCYAEADNLSGRWNWSSGLPYAGEKPANLILDTEKLDKHLRSRRSERVFMCSMTDLFLCKPGSGEPVFHEDWIYEVFAYMALNPQKTYQILTKWPNRAQQLLRFGKEIVRCKAVDIARRLNLKHERYEAIESRQWDWPLPNIWLGATVENQRAADWRIKELLLAPAATYFLSVEPLLESVDISQFLDPVKREACRREFYWNKLRGKNIDPNRFMLCPQDYGLRELQDRQYREPQEDYWVIVGGESGDKARDCLLDAMRSVVRDCKAFDVPVFVKQLGAKPVEFISQVQSTPYIEGIVSTNFAEPKKVPYKTKTKKGGNIEEFPLDLQIRQFP